MGQIKFIGGLLLTAVFGLSLIVFAINFGAENEASISLENIGGFNSTKTAVEGNLSQFRTEVINSSDSFYQSEIQEGETVRTGGQFKLSPATALSAVSNLVVQGFYSIFGAGNSFGFVLNTLLAFLGLILFLYIWKTWAGRNPD